MAPLRDCVIFLSDRKRDRPRTYRCALVVFTYTTGKRVTASAVYNRVDVLLLFIRMYVWFFFFFSSPSNIITIECYTLDSLLYCLSLSCMYFSVRFFWNDTARYLSTGTYEYVRSEGTTPTTTTTTVIIIWFFSLVVFFFFFDPS